MRIGNKMKKITGIVILSLMVLTGYSAFGEEAWRDINIEDVTTGETFKISDFKGKKVVLETFAVWCSTCTKQQKEIKKLHGRIGEDFVSITVDVDPNDICRDAEDVVEIVVHGKAQVCASTAAVDDL